MVKRNAALVTCVLLCGCSQPRSDSASPQDAGRLEPPPLVGKVWVSTDAAAAPGTLRIFLADGTLVMDSCWETYHLAAWRAIDDRRIEWQEDTVRIEAEVTEVTSERLRLQVQLVGETKEETYRPAQVPFVCRDMPR